MEQVRNDIDNMRYLIREYGFMLNGNCTNFLYNSQPPFLSMLMRDYYDITKDKEWLTDAYKELETEHSFWMEKRISDVGLNHYDCMPMPEDMEQIAAKIFRERTVLCMRWKITSGILQVSLGEKKKLKSGLRYVKNGRSFAEST